MEPIKKLQELLSELSKAVEYKINAQKSIVFYISNEKQN